MIKVAFYDAKAYDKPSFEQYGKSNDVQFRFLETKLNEDTAELARGCDAVCVFVNDDVNENVISKLYDLGVKLIALRGCRTTDPCIANLTLIFIHLERDGFRIRQFSIIVRVDSSAYLIMYNRCTLWSLYLHNRLILT